MMKTCRGGECECTVSTPVCRGAVKVSMNIFSAHLSKGLDDCHCCRARFTVFLVSTISRKVLRLKLAGTVGREGLVCDCCCSTVRILRVLRIVSSEMGLCTVSAMMIAITHVRLPVLLYRWRSVGPFRFTTGAGASEDWRLFSNAVLWLLGQSLSGFDKDGIPNLFKVWYSTSSQNGSFIGSILNPGK